MLIIIYSEYYYLWVLYWSVETYNNSHTFEVFTMAAEPFLVLFSFSYLIFKISILVLNIINYEYYYLWVLYWSVETYNNSHACKILFQFFLLWMKIFFNRWWMLTLITIYLNWLCHMIHANIIRQRNLAIRSLTMLDSVC